MNATEKVPIYISQELYNKIRNRVKLSQGEFRDVGEYIEFILNEVVKEQIGHVYTPQEEEEIKSRLRKLGYL